LAEALAVRPRVLEQTRLFVAGLFLIFNAKFEFRARTAPKRSAPTSTNNWPATPATW